MVEGNLQSTLTVMIQGPGMKSEIGGDATTLNSAPQQPLRWD